ncbi:MAG: hypothetical protein ABSF00_10465 [Candidatus Bathyarchaeia archaeon]
MIILSASEVPIEKVIEFCDSLARDVMKDHEKRFAERTKAIRESSSTLSITAGRFESSVKNAWGTMDKAASEYGMRLAHTIQETVDELTQAEPKTKFTDAEKFHEESIHALNKIIVTIRKYLPKLHRGLKTEMAALNTALAKLENSVRSLGAALDESPGAKIESIRREADILARRLDDLLALRKDETECVSTLHSISQRENDLLRDQMELTSQGEFLELRRYQELIRTKEDEMRQFLQPVIKPLVKLERVVSAKQSPGLDTQTLRGLVESPVETLATGQTFAILKVLGQLDDAFSRNELDVEERKKRKAQETILSVKNGAIEAMRQEYLTIQANIQETLRQLRANGLLEKRDKAEESLAQARHEKETVDARHREVKRRIDEVGKDILKQKTALESQLSKLAHRAITIRADQLASS